MCLSVLGEMMEKWGSLRLVSQEGMEAWQKKLNEILRLNNGFANAGAIPKAIKAQGEGKVKEYMEARAKDKPSPARWVFEQGLIQQHAYLVDVERVRDSLETAGRTFYAALLAAHREYFRDVGSELTADDLDEKEKRRQTRRIRRVAYAKPRSYKIFGVCHQRRRRRGRRR